MFNYSKSDALDSVTPPAKNYLYYDLKYENTHNRRCIDGSITGCGNCVGYCQYAGHRGFLTKEQRKNHNCIGKGCFYYLPKIKRERVPKAVAEHPHKIVEIVSDLLSEYEGLRVMAAKKRPEGGWLLKYITITNGYPITSLEDKISETIGEAIVMINLNYDFDRAAQLIFAL